MRRGVLGLTVGLAFLSGGQAFGDQVTLEEAIRRAIEHSPEVRAAEQEVAKAKDQRLSALGQMGPKLGMSGKLMRWDAPTDVSMGFEIPEPLKQQLGIQLPSALHVMDQTTGDLSFSATQPITPLYALYSLYRLQGAGEKAAMAGRESKERTLASRVSEAFFGILKLGKALETTSAARSQVEAHLKTAQAFFAQGYVQRDDVLRAEVALAKVEEGQRQVETALAVTKAALNIMMGRPMDEDVTPVGEFADPPAPLAMTMEEAIEKALKLRPELAEMRQRVEMARAGRHAAIGAMLPTLAATFNWNRQWGNDFQRKTTYFIGGILQWDFWNWGAKFFQVKAAERDIARAEEGLRGLADMVTLEVKQAYLEARMRAANLETARKAVAQAEEAYRIATKKYEQRMATSMEVLDGESALTGARNTYSDALYSYYLAVEKLRQAVGERGVK